MSARYPGGWKEKFMGYDCTFHLVDERAVREEFVPRLLGRSQGETALDRVHQNAAGLWALGRRALEEGVNEEGEPMDADDVASLLCQLALVYSSCSLPHHYERGWAFSLWPVDAAGAAFPDRFAHSPEPLFAEVVRACPRLKGKFPKWFSGNYSTGVYVPADKVAKVRRWLEGVLEPLPKGDRRMFRGLMAVLRAAEERGLAYWEATDLAIPIMGQVPGDPGLLTADYLHNVPGGVAPAEKHELPRQLDRVGGRGDVHVLTDHHPDRTVVLDLGGWPPRRHARKREFVWNADADQDGRWLLVSRAGVGDHRNPVRGRVLRDLRKDPELILEVEEGGAEVKVNDGFLVAGRVVLIPDPDGLPVGAELHVWMQEGDRMVRAPGLPPHRVRADRYSNAWIVRGVARLASGSEVLVWDGEGYEWDGARFQHTFPLALTDPYDDLSAVPAGEDGFYFIHKRKLYEVHRAKKKVRQGPKWTNVMAMLPGPEGGLLLKEGGNPDGDIGKLYFPGEKTFIHIEPELLGDQDLYDFLCWSQQAERIVASDRHNLYAVPVASILALPRFHARTGEAL
jgi:hypothetical protein